MVGEIEKEWKTIFRDDFSAYGEGPFSEGYSPVREFHMTPKRVDQGAWQEISSHHLWDPSRNPEFPNWRIVSDAGEKRLKQTLSNFLNKRNWKYPIKKLFFKSRIQLILALPALVTGEESWSDYCVSADVRPLTKDDYVGIVFRAMNAQSHYIFALKNDKAFLLRRLPGDLQKIAESPCEYLCTQYHSLSVIAEEDHIRCFIDGRLVLETVDRQFAAGRVGVCGNVPALFRKVVVLEPPASRNRKGRLGRDDGNERKDSLKRFPGMKLWKRVEIPSLCSGRTIRFGDLTGDGRPDLLIAQGKQLKNDHFKINCLTAVNLDGEVIWQKGTLMDEHECLASDLPFQIYDIDGDGQNEVICVIDFEILVLDGKTGRVKNKKPTPDSTTPGNDFPQILGDCLYVADLSGKSRPSDLLLKDRYSKIYAYDDHLEQLWKHECSTGHFPFSSDIDGSGREKVLIGYTLLDASGRKVWELPLGDHADAVAMVRFPGEKEYHVIIAASDEGLVFADMRGRIRKHLRLGHMQTVTVADLQGDSSGLQIATNTFWGNPGVIYILNENGDILRTFQPSVYGSTLDPVNWTGGTQRLLLLSARSNEEGGLYDGFGRQVVTFPDDGHPELCSAAVDLTGDGRDELVCWDFETLWIYTQSSPPEASPVSGPATLPAVYNGSNYRSNICIPSFGG